MSCLRLFNVFLVLTVVIFLLIILHINKIRKSHKQEYLYEYCCSRKTSQNIPLKINNSKVFNRLSESLQYNIISGSPNENEIAEKFAKYLEKSFPEIYISPYVTVVNLSFALLYKIEGGSERNPYLLTADLDTENFEEASCHHQELYEIDNEENNISGIGTLSSKNIVMSILEALNMYLLAGNIPKRSFYIMFLKDGKIFGYGSSQKVLEYFQTNNIFFDFILESPGVVFNQSIPGVNLFVGIVGITRKGNVEMKLNTIESDLNNVTNTLFKTISEISKSQQNMFGYGIELLMLEVLSQVTLYPYNLVYYNLWLFKPFLSYLMNSNEYWKSIIKTKSFLKKFDVFRMTHVSALVKQVVHYKLNVFDIIQHNNKLINEHGINMQIIDVHNPSQNLYDFKTDAFLTIKQSFQSTFPNAIVIPGDSFTSSNLRNFEGITKNIYQFSPVIFEYDGIQRFRTSLEKISLTNYLYLIRYYYFLMAFNDELA